jgi:hypothetical protein
MQRRGVDAGSGRHPRPAGSLLTSNEARPAFDRETLALLDREREVEIETVRQDGSPKRTIIWVVVDGQDAFVRSWLAERGWWYQHALERPTEVTLHVHGRSIPVTAVHVTDEDSIERCTRGLETKYRNSMSTASMVTPNVLPFTMRLVPR